MRMRSPTRFSYSPTIPAPARNSDTDNSNTSRSRSAGAIAGSPATSSRANSYTRAVFPVPGWPMISAFGRRILSRFFCSERRCVAMRMTPLDGGAFSVRTRPQGRRRSRTSERSDEVRHVRVGGATTAAPVSPSAPAPAPLPPGADSPSADPPSAAAAASISAGAIPRPERYSRTDALPIRVRAISSIVTAWRRARSWRTGRSGSATSTRAGAVGRNGSSDGSAAARSGTRWSSAPVRQAAASSNSGVSDPPSGTARLARSSAATASGVNEAMGDIAGSYTLANSSWPGGGGGGGGTFTPGSMPEDIASAIRWCAMSMDGR